MSDKLATFIGYAAPILAAGYCLFDSFTENGGEIAKAVADTGASILTSAIALGGMAIATCSNSSATRRIVCGLTFAAGMLMTDKLERLGESGWYIGRDAAQETEMQAVERPPILANH